jgi:hypothetical protein
MMNVFWVLWVFLLIVGVVYFTFLAIYLGRKAAKNKGDIKKK